MSSEDLARFTDRARRTLTLAGEEARRFDHNYIGTEHVLLGLLLERDGVAAKVLAFVGVELEKVRESVEMVVRRGTSPVTEQPGLTPRAKAVIELAREEARRSNHSYVGTEHLLLGLLDESEGLAAGILRTLGVEAEAVRAHIADALAVMNGEPGRVGRRTDQPKSTVVMCRVDAADLDAIETLIEAGIRANRSDAAGWLIKAGLESKRAVLDSVREKVREIRALRETARALAESAERDGPSNTEAGA